MVLSCFIAKKLRSCNILFGVFSSFLSLLDIAICKMLLLCKRSGLQHCWLTRKFTASWWRVPWQNLEFFLSSQNWTELPWRRRCSKTGPPWTSPFSPVPQHASACLSMPQDMPQDMPDVSRHGRSGASLGSEPGFRCGSAFAAAG